MCSVLLVGYMHTISGLLCMYNISRCSCNVQCPFSRLYAYNIRIVMYICTVAAGVVVMCSVLLVGYF